MKSHYIQRELSWNEFNRRVLHEGLRNQAPLMDRLKFIAITASNYDEFFKVRVARLMRDAEKQDAPLPPTGECPSKILETLLQQIHQVTQEMNHALLHEILPALADAGLELVPPENWTLDDMERAKHIFENELLPICTPLDLGSLSPSTSIHLPQDHIYAMFLLDKECPLVVRLPDNLERFRDFGTREKRRLISLEDILLVFGEQLFPQQKICKRGLFRVTRDADMSVDEQRDESFVAAMEEVLERRETGFPVRLETKGDSHVANHIREILKLPEANHFDSQAPLRLSDFFFLAKLSGFSQHKSQPIPPQIPQELDGTMPLWSVLKERDVLLHHPYESYSPVVRMVEDAAADSATLAIKMTLYRISGNSPIAAALIRAAERGVQVTVLIELKARFDEGANMAWAERLEKAGAIVIHGLKVLKVHAKALLVVRKEEQGIRRYLHVGTGNYNDVTARLYTDLGFITGRDSYTRDAARFFNAITGYSSEPHLDVLSMAPFSLRRETLRLIHREEERARGGEEARIIAKMNSLVDSQIIDALYAASQAGVLIQLNIRGICCLRPGLPGLSENIQVVSVIDGFLEHTRAFYYLNGGNPEVYLSSADWMPRNLDRRVELLIPVCDSHHIRRISGILETFFKDNCRAWNLSSDGTWNQASRSKSEPNVRAQEVFAQSAQNVATKLEDAERHALEVRRRSPVKNRPEN